MGGARVAVFAVAWTVFFNVVLYFLNENSILSSCVRHKGTLAITNRGKYVHPVARPRYFLAWDLIDPLHMVAGYRVGVWFILTFRCLALVYFAATVAYQGTLGTGLTVGWLKYFTNWTFILMGLYSLLGIAVGVKALQQPSSRTRKYAGSIVPPVKEGMDAWDVLEKSLMLTLTTACSNGIFLTAFYWLVLYDSREDLKLDNPLRHGGNVAIMLADVMLSRFPVVSYHLQVSVAFTTIYGAFMWINFLLTGEWVYKALDWSKDGSGVYYFVLPILVSISFYIMHAAAGLREYLAIGRCCYICGCCSFCGDCCDPRGGYMRTEEDDVELAVQ